MGLGRTEPRCSRLPPLGRHLRGRLHGQAARLLLSPAGATRARLGRAAQLLLLALRFAAPTVFVAVVRQPSGRYAILIEPVEVQHTGDREADIDAIVLRYTQILERLVREHPEQYFWQHRRWRRQPPDTPPHLREP